MTKNLIQAYRQTPWRVQLQRLGVVLALLVAIAIVAGLYLNISAQAATAGLEFQQLEEEREDLQRQIADLNARLAFITSEAQMLERAKKLGFKPLALDKAVYVVIEGFIGRTLPSFAPAPGAGMIKEPVLKASYTQSLWDFLYQGLLGNSSSTGGLQ